jgi:hypothetical protein
MFVPPSAEIAEIAGLQLARAAGVAASSGMSIVASEA